MEQVDSLKRRKWATANLRGKSTRLRVPYVGKRPWRQRSKIPTTDEYVSAELFVGPLTLERIDVGGTLKLTISPDGKVGIGGDIELGKCAILACATGGGMDFSGTT